MTSERICNCGIKESEHKKIRHPFIPIQETLYTEEQVREAIDMSRKGIITEAYGDLEIEYLFEKEEILQSLKQPKQ